MSWLRASTDSSTAERALMVVHLRPAGRAWIVRGSLRGLMTCGRTGRTRSPPLSSERGTHRVSRPVLRRGDRIPSADSAPCFQRCLSPAVRWPERLWGGLAPSAFRYRHSRAAELSRQGSLTTPTVPAEARPAPVPRSASHGHGRLSPLSIESGGRCTISCEEHRPRMLPRPPARCSDAPTARPTNAGENLRTASVHPRPIRGTRRGAGSGAPRYPRTGRPALPHRQPRARTPHRRSPAPVARPTAR